MGKYALLLVKIYVNMNIVEHTSSGLGDTERDLCACISVCDCVCENKCYLDHRNTFFFSIMILQVFSMCNVCVSVCVCVCVLSTRPERHETTKTGSVISKRFLIRVCNR